MKEELEIEEQDEEQDLYEHYHIVVDKGQTPLRIDKFLMVRLENATRNKIQNAAHAGNILVNDLSVKPNYKVKPNDVVSIVLAYPPRETEVLPEDIPLHIEYEDSDILIINKPSEMVVHPGYGNYTGTLVNALAYYFRSANPDCKPCLVHRIDKNTSGLLLIAKNEIAQSFLAKQFFEHSVERKYWALVWGDFQEDQGTIVGNIGRCLKDRKIMSVFPEGDYGKHAVTHYKIVERLGYVTLLECVLETGRTHQIRAHLRSIKHPLFNDAAYGGDQILKGTIFSKYKQYIQNCFEIIPRQALHAKTLGFIHPATKKKMMFDSGLPDDFANVLEKWRNYSQYNEFKDDEE